MNISNTNNIITDNSKDYTGLISKNGVKIIKPVGRNNKNQLVWECECGICGNSFWDLPSVILNNHKKSCGCLKTYNKNKSNINIRYSFYDWCIDSGNEYILDLWDYKLNKLSPKDISYKTSKKYYFKCINGKSNHLSEKRSLNKIVNKGYPKYGCSQCNSFAQWGINNFGDDFLDEYWDYNKNDINPWNISYKSNNKVWIICQNKKYHESYFVSCNKFVGDGCRCPYCNMNSGKVHKLDSVGSLHPEIFKFWSNKNLKNPYEYSPQTNKKIWLKCKCGIHDDYEIILNNAINRNFRCPKCIETMNDSILENAVKKYLKEKYNYNVLTEYNCNLKPINPKTNYIMPFDNEIKELKLIIEVNGEQHYKITYFTKLIAKRKNISENDELRYQQWKDAFKRYFAIINGYEYLEIPYYLYENEEYKNVIDKKIKEIIS